MKISSARGLREGRKEKRARGKGKDMKSSFNERERGDGNEWENHRLPMSLLL
jgi:hypothetical protein